MEAIQVCQICNDVVTNHICANCISENIKMLLPDSLKGYVNDFHERVSKMFMLSKHRLKYCQKCGVSDAPSVCWVCYIKEFFTWSRGLKPEIAKELKKSLRFRLFQKMKEHKFVPITEHEHELSMDGTCENCESYSEELRMVEGMWLCSECRAQPTEKEVL